MGGGWRSSGTLTYQSKPMVDEPVSAKAAFANLAKEARAWGLTNRPSAHKGLFERVQAILSGRLPGTRPKQRAYPDFPPRGFVRCESCGRGLSQSWSTGRSGSRFEMTLGEGSVRAGFHVAFEPYGYRFVGQFDRCH
jgi:hypothetical protein